MRHGRNDFETRHRTRQGEIRNVHVTAQIIEILGRPVYHCIWRDITDRTRAQRALAERSGQLGPKKLTSPARTETLNDAEEAEPRKRTPANAGRVRVERGVRHG